MVEQQLRGLGLRIRGAERPPTEDVRCPTGRPASPRPGWENFLVTQRRVGEPWPEEAANQITAARACYEAGTHEMVQLTTKEGWNQLYLKPRNTPTERRSYFSDTGAA